MYIRYRGKGLEVGKKINDFMGFFFWGFILFYGGVLGFLGEEKPQKKKTPEEIFFKNKIKYGGTDRWMDG